jgi:hypothetical protein
MTPLRLACVRCCNKYSAQQICPQTARVWNLIPKKLTVRACFMVSICHGRGRRIYPEGYQDRIRREIRT